MREYPVPFSTREETPFMGGLSIREMLWIGGGFIMGLLATAVLFSLLRADVRNMIICLPAALPFMFLGYYLAKKKVTEDDKKVTFDKHCFKRFKYKRRPHIFLNYRRGGG